MASRPWSDAELAVLNRHAEERDWFSRVTLDGRSAASLRSMMQKVRLSRGMSDQRCVDSAWMADAINGTRRLLEATLRVGTWA